MTCKICVCFCRNAGDVRTTFSGNTASKNGGDVWVSNSVLNVEQADMHNSSAGEKGGSLFVTGNSTATLVDVSITGSQASDSGGGLVAERDVHVRLSGCVIAACSCNDGKGTCFAGGVAVRGQAVLEMADTSLLNNSATDRGGGMVVWDEASWKARNVLFKGNRAGSYGGALHVTARFQLAGPGSLKVTHNRAGQSGGGLVIATSNFRQEDLRFLLVANNNAPFSPNVAMNAMKIEVVGDLTSFQNFVASIDSDGGVLPLVLNVSGAHGLPSADSVMVYVFNAQGVRLALQSFPGRENEALRPVPLKLRNPPGEDTPYCCTSHRYVGRTASPCTRTTVAASSWWPALQPMCSC